MIRVERTGRGTDISIEMNLLDDQEQTSQVFAQWTHKDLVSDTTAANLQVIDTLRRQFDTMMKDLEYVITKQKRKDYTIQCGEIRPTSRVIGRAGG